MAKLKVCIVLIAAFCIAFTLPSCHKSKKRDYVELDSDSSVIKHFNFLPGTYWVYVDSKSGRIDSFYVRSNAHVPQMEAYNIYDYHIITIAEVNLDNTNPGDSANWVFNYQANRIMLDYDYTTFAWGWQNEIQYRPLFRYPFVYGDQQSESDTASVTQIDSALIINGMPFYNVVHVYHYADPSPGAGPNITKLTDLFYVNDSVGMVEMNLSHPTQNINRDWKLLRYKIVK